MADRVGFIGLGIMGSRMSANLRRAGFELVVWNRTAARAEAWAAEHGGVVADRPRDVAEQCDRVITMVVDGPQVEHVLLGDDSAAVNGARQGALFIDMSTIGPAATERIGSRLAERSVSFMDAPVTGSSPKAEDGTLTIMAGGEPGDFERARPLFEAMGELILHVGTLGSGQMVKLINNTVAATNAAVVAEALLLGNGTGVDLDKLVAVMKAGSGGSAMLDLKEGPMRERDYTTLFKLAHMLKDVRLCLDEAGGAGQTMKFGELTAKLLAEADAAGYGEADFAAVIEAVSEAEGARDR
jgi:3-hydroxyisobutyrate dehydrogenase-like beta-hydroxyacid dehydrogenase